MEKLAQMRVVVRHSGADYEVFINKQNKVKQLREVLQRSHPTVFTTGKMLKRLTFRLGDTVLGGVTGRTELGSQGVVENSIITATDVDNDGGDAPNQQGGGYPDQN